MTDVIYKEWRCFHCDEVFTTIGAAEEHFGTTEGAEPGCKIDQVAVEEGGKPERGRGLLMALRKAEAEIRQLRRDCEELENDSRLWHESEADRVRRIGHVQWWQELDSREGERLVLEARVKALEQASLEETDLRASAAERLAYARGLNRDQRWSITYGELPPSVMPLIESHIWDNKNISEQRDWALQQLVLALAHDMQPYPTAEAYVAVCKTREAWQARAERAEQEAESASSLVISQDQQLRQAAVLQAFLSRELATAQAVIAHLKGGDSHVP